MREYYTIDYVDEYGDEDGVHIYTNPEPMVWKKLRYIVMIEMYEARMKDITREMSP